MQDIARALTTPADERLSLAACSLADSGCPDSRYRPQRARSEPSSTRRKGFQSSVKITDAHVRGHGQAAQLKSLAAESGSDNMVCAVVRPAARDQSMSVSDQQGLALHATIAAQRSTSRRGARFNHEAESPVRSHLVSSQTSSFRGAPGSARAIRGPKGSLARVRDRGR